MICSLILLKWSTQQSWRRWTLWVSVDSISVLSFLTGGISHCHSVAGFRAISEYPIWKDSNTPLACCHWTYQGMISIPSPWRYLRSLLSNNYSWARTRLLRLFLRPLEISNSCSCSRARRVVSPALSLQKLDCFAILCISTLKITTYPALFLQSFLRLWRA